MWCVCTIIPCNLHTYTYTTPFPAAFHVAFCAAFCSAFPEMVYSYVEWYWLAQIVIFFNQQPVFVSGLGAIHLLLKLSHLWWPSQGATLWSSRLHRETKVTFTA